MNEAQISQALQDLVMAGNAIPLASNGQSTSWAKPGALQEWATRCQNMLRNVFGENSPHSINFDAQYNKGTAATSQARLQAMIGIVNAARLDFNAGHLFNIQKEAVGEVFGDLLTLAKRCLSEDAKDAAAVLACAALEDALKRCATAQGLMVDGKSMQDVINALKGKGFFTGAKRGLIDQMPRIRDSAMHADWAKIQPIDVSGVIGFTEQLLLENF